MRESGEMYLETIYLLQNRQEEVRSVDIAKKMNFTKPTVSRAVGILKDDGYIKIDENGLITLTKKGEKISENIYEKHKVLYKFFKDIIKVSPEIAEQDACKIEHIISDESFSGIKKFIKEY